MWETSARLLRLLTLLQAHRDWSGFELADRLGVSPRTVRRDVDKLRALGYPVNATGGVGGGYQLTAGASLPPLVLDDEGAVAVAIGLRTAVGGAVTGIAETSVRALTKLDQVLPSRLRYQVNTLSAALVTVPAPGPTVDPSVLVAIASAIRDLERLRFDYVSYDGSGSLRDVEPYRLVHHGRRWYVFGWDVTRSDWRKFRADRVSVRIPNGPRFVPRPLPAEDLPHYFATAMVTDQYRYRAVLTMYGPAHEVADEVPPTLGAVEPVNERTCVLRIGSDSLDHLAVWIAAFGFEFDIREPPELVEHVRTLSDRMGRSVRPGARAALGEPGAAERSTPGEGDREDG